MPLFGTDGVRGLANGILTADLALTLAQATAVVLGQGRTAEARKAEGKRLSAVVARDPRISGEFLVIPTPALAFLVADHDADFGVMVSASHNPAPDNGIKIFARGGVKLPDEVEARIEAAMSGDMLLPTGEGVGRIQRFSDAEDRYKLHLLGSLPHSLDGIHVVLDCAHGAASGVSPETFRTAGAEVTVIGAEPDGININDGVGSTHLDNLAEAVVRLGADVGIAHDGDADRCLAVDADGNTIDGDQIMAVLAVAMKERGHLADDTLVATVMSNLGLHMAMKEHGIAVRQTAVGDRYVLEDMNAGGYSLGGEQSGHVIMSEFATTGDGLLSGLHLVAEMARQKKTLAELASVMTVYPQVLINVRGVDKDRVADDEGVQSAVASVEAELGETGRVLLRKSGTEPLVRVMVEAADAESAQSYAEKLADVVRDRRSDTRHRHTQISGDIARSDDSGRTVSPDSCFRLRCGVSDPDAAPAHRLGVAHENALAQRPGRHLELVEVEHLHRGVQRYRGRDDLEGAVGGDPGKLLAGGCRDAGEPRDPGFQRGARHHGAVESEPGDLAPGQVRERPDGLG